MADERGVCSRDDKLVLFLIYYCRYSVAEVNDVISLPKQFSIVIVVFTLCILLMTMMSNFALTFKSEKILRFFDVPSSEAHIMDSEIFGEVFVDQSTYKTIIADTEKLLADNGMPGHHHLFDRIQRIGHSCKIIDEI